MIIQVHGLSDATIRSRRAGKTLFLCAQLCVCFWGLASLFAEQAESAPPPGEGVGEPAEAQTLFVAEYRVKGATKLSPAEIGQAVYPYLGPHRTLEDIEQARVALEKAFHEKGYQSVTVEIPQQRGGNGVIFMQVNETRVGRLSVRGSRFFDIEKIRRQAKSLREGNVPNFEEVQREIMALNRHPDRRVVPSIRPGAEAGTIDVDLEVSDTFPLHGAVELNNRYSPDTTPLRLDLSARYSNLWQEGHTLGFGFQIAPQRPSDAMIYTGFYLLPVPWIDNLSFMVQGTRQDSDVSTLGGAAAVVGSGQSLGFRFLYDLPMGEGFFHSLAVGWDYKHFGQQLDLADETDPDGTPVTYFPFIVSYSATWMGEGYQTELSGSLNWNFRNVGSSGLEFENRRFGTDGGYLYFRGNFSHVRTLPMGFQAFGKVQGQLSGQPLIDSEQFSGGGLYTVRGYLESVVLGDNAVATTVELRSPNFLWWLDERNEWRIYGFFDGGYWTLVDALPGQQADFSLASIGGGSRLRLNNFINGSIDLGMPLITQPPSLANSLLVTFRVWAAF